MNRIGSLSTGNYTYLQTKCNMGIESNSVLSTEYAHINKLILAATSREFQFCELLSTRLWLHHSTHTHTRARAITYDQATATAAAPASRLSSVNRHTGQLNNIKFSIIIRCDNSIVHMRVAMQIELAHTHTQTNKHTNGDVNMLRVR